MTKPLPRAGSLDTPDDELARRVAKGDPAAFEALMRRHNRTMFRTARAILHDDAEAEDALQEAYLQAYRTIGGFRGDAKFSTWMARVVANEALARLRKQVRRAAIVPLQGGVEIDEVNPTMEDSMDKGPESAARRTEMRKLLEKRIDALPGAYRPVFMLRAVEETAAILQIPAATVRSRFHRARSLLREGLASEVDLAYEEVFGFAGERCDRIVASVMQRIAKEPR